MSVAMGPLCPGVADLLAFVFIGDTGLRDC
jgi:hypothetical protein